MELGSHKKIVEILGSQEDMSVCRETVVVDSGLHN
jgi:hypothetical protein